SEVAEMKARFFLFDNVDVESRAANVTGYRVVVAIGVDAERGFSFGQKPRCRERANNLYVFRVFSSPVLDDIERDVRADGDRPVYTGHGEPRSCARVPESWDFDVFGVPVPASHILAERIERRVGDDFVFGRRDSG